MRGTFRKAATAIAMAAILAGASGCSGVKKGNRVSDSAPDSPAAVSAGAPANVGAEAPGRVTQAAFNEDADGARIVVTADVPLLYTAYEPRPDLLVIEMNGVRLADGFLPPESAGNLVQSVRIETIEEMGKRMTRLSVAHRPGLKYDLRSVGRGLALAFETGQAAVAEPESAPVPPTVTAELLAPPAVVRGSSPTPSKRSLPRPSATGSRFTSWRTDTSVRPISCSPIRLAS